MSATELFPFDANGEAHTVLQIGNGFGGAMAVWTGVARKYVPGYEGFAMMMDGASKVIALTKSERIQRWERIVILTTCDKCLVKAENFAEVAEAMETFYEQYKGVLAGQVFHLNKQAEILRRLDSEREEKGWTAVGWNQTSVNGDCPWYGTHDEDDEHHAFNLNKEDKGQWYLMDDIAQIEEELAAQNTQAQGVR